MTEKVSLSGGPERTATWIWTEDGRLKVEYYDFSELAQQMFGNDIAYTLTVTDMEQLYTASGQKEPALIGWMGESFGSYFEIKQWLEDRSIGFSIEIESWA
jgi:hypothetical protein